MAYIGDQFNSLRAEDVKREAAGRWQQILANVCRLTTEQLRPGYRGPCPKCGGDDRFSPLKDIAETGGLLCRKCHNGDSSPKAGDGLAAVQWLLACRFHEALQAVSNEVGGRGCSSSSPVKTAVGGKTIHPTRDAAADAAAWGLQQNRKLPEKPKPANVWTYYNAAGQEVGAVVRLNLADGKKEFCPLRVEGGGWVCGATNEPRPLYGLPLLAAADLSQPVFVVEGEKAADAGQALNLCCITSSNGSSAASKTEWKPVQGRQVVIIPDNDEPGESYAADVARLCQAAGASSVGVLRLPTIWPECPEKGDLADFSEAFDSRTAEELRSMLEGAEVESMELDSIDAPVDTKTDSAEGLQFFDAWPASFNPPPHKEVIIEGMLRRGEVGNVIAATKAGKSWFALQLLMKVATGADWLGRRVSKGHCLLIDNELQKSTLENRLADVRYKLGIDPSTDRRPFEFLPLRGKWKPLKDLATGLLQRYGPGDLTLIVLDAKYRFFCGDGFEENSNDAQTDFHNTIDKLAEDLDCGVLMVHHATKGDQSGKSVVDMGAGGGAQARAADLHCVLRDHELPGHAVLQAAVRSFPPVEPQTLRYDWPLWSVVSGVSPQVAKPKKRGDTDEMLLKIQKHLSDEWQSLSKLAERCGTKYSRPVFADLIQDMNVRGLIEFNNEYKPPRSQVTTIGVRRTADTEPRTVSADRD